MQYLVLSLLFITSALGIACGAYSTINSKSLFTSSEARLSQKIANSLLMAVSASLIFLSIIFIAGLLDRKFIWTLPKILSFALFSLVPGILVFLGSSWQFLIVNWFRK